MPDPSQESRDHLSSIILTTAFIAFVDENEREVACSRRPFTVVLDGEEFSSRTPVKWVADSVLRNPHLKLALLNREGKAVWLLPRRLLSEQDANGALVHISSSRYSEDEYYVIEPGQIEFSFEVDHAPANPGPKNPARS